jgi:hypothetical protein
MPIKEAIIPIRQKIATQFPFFRDVYRILRWKGLQTARRAYIRTQSSVSGIHVDPYKIYWIDTDSIRYGIYAQIKGVPNTGMAAGVIKGGDWDRKAIPIDDITIIKSGKQKFSQGLKWEETSYYREMMDCISRGQTRRGCKTEEDVVNYYRKFDSLYEKIKNKGYKLQNEIRDTEFGGTSPVENEIAVHIDRNGHFLFCNGAHRLAIALALGIKHIPVNVSIRHKEWHEFCQQVMAHIKKNNGQTYQPIPHPDLEDIPSAHGEERFDIIKPHVPDGKVTILDIGANWGYFCQRFEDFGCDCYAVELEPENLYFMKKIKKANYKLFKVVGQSILTYKEKNDFDVVLALNIFHHFLKNKVDYDNLVSFLERIKMKMMFFEPHNPSESQMKGAYRNYDPEQFVNFILKHSGFSNADEIAIAKDGRPIYKLFQK